MTYRSPHRKTARNCGNAVVYRLPDDGDTKLRAALPRLQHGALRKPAERRRHRTTTPDGRVLLCKRNIEPRWGKWTLPQASWSWTKPPRKAQPAKPMKRPGHKSRWARCSAC